MDLFPFTVFFSHYGLIFLLLCMSVKFLLDAGHYGFFVVGCLDFVAFIKDCWALFWSPVNLCVVKFDPFKSCF